MDGQEEEVRGLERARDSALAGDGPVVFYGSSSIRLWTTLREDFPGVPVVNKGFGGSTLADCVYYFDRLVTPRRPRSLIVYAGDNDLGEGQPPQAVLASFRALLQKAEPLGPIPLAFLSIKPSPARYFLLDSIRRANDLIRAELLTHPAGIYIDVYSAMLDAQLEPRPELYAEDGLHLSREGYRLWTQIVTAYSPQLF